MASDDDDDADDDLGVRMKLPLQAIEGGRLFDCLIEFYGFIELRPGGVAGGEGLGR